MVLEIVREIQEEEDMVQFGKREKLGGLLEEKVADVC